MHGAQSGFVGNAVAVTPRAPGLAIWAFVKDHILTPIGKGIAFVAESIQTAVEERRLYVQTMMELGWPPTKVWDGETKSLVLRILGTRTANDASQEIEAALLVHFNAARLGKMKATWLQYGPANKRAPILEDILAGHAQGHYWLTVPTTHAQIDGLLAEGFGLTNGGGSVSWRRLGKLLTAAKWKGGAHGAVLKFLDHKVTVNFSRGQPLESDHSRHAIAHGADINYGTAKNSLKAILLLDYVIWALTDLRFIQNGIYHQTGCPQLVQPLEGLKLIRHPMELFMNREIGTVVPCMQCNAAYWAPNDPANVSRPSPLTVSAITKAIQMESGETTAGDTANQAGQDSVTQSVSTPTVASAGESRHPAQLRQ